MALRTRIKDHGTTTGTLNRTGTPVERTVSNGRDQINDEDGWVFHRTLWIDKTKIKGGILNGKNPSSITEFVNYPCTIRTSSVPHLSIPFPPTGSLSTKLLKGTNPSTPDVDIPLAIAELKDLPSLVREFWGKNLIRNAADANLRYQFGLRPMLSDIRKLCTFPTLANARFKRLKKLSTNRAEVKKMTLHVGREVDRDDRYTIQSSGALVHTIRVRNTVAITRGYAQWLVTDSNFPVTDEGLMKLATRATGGLSFSPDLIWNLIPFSWLVDWYGNIGDYIAANRNSVGVTPGISRLTRETTTIDIASPYSYPSWLEVSALERERVTKERFPTSLSFAASLPALNNSQWGILGSILALKLGRK